MNIVKENDLDKEKGDRKFQLKSKLQILQENSKNKNSNGINKCIELFTKGEDEIPNLDNTNEIKDNIKNQLFKKFEAKLVEPKFEEARFSITSNFIENADLHSSKELNSNEYINKLDQAELNQISQNVEQSTQNHKNLIQKYKDKQNQIIHKLKSNLTKSAKLLHKNQSNENEYKDGNNIKNKNLNLEININLNQKKLDKENNPSFTPNFRGNMFRRSKENFYQSENQYIQGLKRLDDKKKRLVKLKKLIEQRELEEVTFKPKINKVFLRNINSNIASVKYNFPQDSKYLKSKFQKLAKRNEHNNTSKIKEIKDFSNTAFKETLKDENDFIENPNKIPTTKDEKEVISTFFMNINNNKKGSELNDHSKNNESLKKVNFKNNFYHDKEKGFEMKSKEQLLEELK